MTGFYRRASFGLAVMIGVSMSALAIAGEASKPEPAKTAAARAPAQTPDKTRPVNDVQQQFCLNNAISANDAKLAWQAARLSELEVKLKQRIAELEAKRADYVEWVRKRDEAMSKAADNVVAIYARIKPDAAALQIAAMDDAMAAALLAKLNTRSASTILNEMEPGRAARLTNAMVGPTGSDRKRT